MGGAHRFFGVIWLGVKRLILFLSGILCAATIVSGCASSGPSGRDLISAAHEDQPSFALVELSGPSLDLVANWHHPTFSAVFSDYRGPKIQKVDVGDTVQINIWETGTGGLFSTPGSDLAGSGGGARSSAIPEQVVARDGTINVPFAGRIRVAGKTPVEIESKIINQLAGKTADPQAMVTLTRNVSYSATVTGDVTSGARVPLSPNGDRVLDVIAMAGGIKAPVHESFITVSRDGMSLTVPMHAILSNTRENIYVRPGDVVTVFRAPQSFTAFGATGRNAVIGFDAGGITLEEAMGKAGGLLDDRADPKGVFILRYEPVDLVRQYPQIPQYLLEGSVVPVVYRLDMTDPTSLFRARRFSMRDKDILYVSHAPINEVEKAFRVFQSLTSPVVSGARVYNGLAP
ncbi:MAG: polysaccharide export protein [Alphaproteobacteria bacterium]|nr:polysaccharide export protein [Alphaproteobacteria bacterium]